MKKVLLALWQAPQILFGLLVVLFLKARPSRRLDCGARVWWCTALLGVSFGPIIVLYERAELRAQLHEIGHSKQSTLLGPLYLVVIGLSSLIMNLLTRAGVLRADRYYKRWPESWADSLGGVERLSNIV